MKQGADGDEKSREAADKGDIPFPQSPSGMTANRWRAAVERYAAGEPIRELAREYDVSSSSVYRWAKLLQRRKRDVGAPTLPKGPVPVTVEAGAGGAGRIACADLAFRFDRDDPVATVHAIYDRLEAATREGREPEAIKLWRMADRALSVSEKLERAVERRATRRARAAAAETALIEAARPTLTLRPSQRPPEGRWATWLLLGGRGAGKTLAGATWLADQAERLGPGGRLALIGPTLHDVREVMIEGASGLCALPRWDAGRRPRFEPSRRRLTFPNGCVAHAFSAEDPDSLRGPQFNAAWADEFCAWPAHGRRGAGETLALLRMGLRLPPATGGEDDAPRLVVTTTPRPTRALKALKAEASCVTVRAATAENAAHLSPGFLEGLRALYGGTRREAQELEGRIVETDGALFTAEMLARAREGRGSGGGGRGGPTASPPFDAVVVAIDPPATAGGDACGIVAAGARARADGRREAVVLADRSATGLTPDGWARRAIALAGEVGAAWIVAEVNQGGDMVTAVLKAAGWPPGRVRAVRATRGKRLRAEPVAALYEQGRVRHAPVDGGDAGAGLEALEEELMALGGEDDGAEDAGSLDRADALVWAVTHLLVDAPDGERGPRVRVA